MKTYWLHRITGGNNGWEFAHALLEKENLLSIGWSDFATKDFVSQTKIKGIRHIDDSIKNDWGEEYLSRSRWNLYRFICSMKEGDYIIVPLWKSFSVYEIVDDVVFSNESLPANLSNDLDSYNVERKGKYLYISNLQENNNIDLGFYRKVLPIAINVPRENFGTQSLISRMKIRQTNADISDLREEIENSISAFKNNHPINLKEEIIKSSVDNILQQIRKNLDADKFEALVEWYLKSLGAIDVSTPAKNSSSTEEGDADKVAVFEKLKLILMVQVKKHIDVTSSWAVQQITLFKANNKFDDEYSTLMWVISSCDDYSSDAKLLAKENNVRLITGPEFAQLIIENGVENLPL